MNYLTIAQVIANVRHKLENKEIDGHKVTVTDTSECEFLKRICLLVPSEFAHSTNLFWIHPLHRLVYCCSGESIKDHLIQRIGDVSDMISRVLVWYDNQLPPTTPDNEVNLAYLIQLKEMFKQLKRIADQVQANNAIETTSSWSCCPSSDQSCCRSSSNYAYYDTSCCELCCGCAYFCCKDCMRCVIEFEQLRYHNQGVASQAAGDGYSGGTIGYFTGEGGGYVDASAHEMCWNWCSDVCGKKCANNTCCMYKYDQGIAAAMNGDHAPKNCCGACAYEVTKGHENVRACYCSLCDCKHIGCGGCIGDMGQMFLGCFKGTGKICGSLFHLWLEWATFLCEHVGDLCKCICEAIGKIDCKDIDCKCGDCGNACSGCGNDCGKMCTGIVGFFAAVGGAIFDQLGNSDNKNKHNEGQVDGGRRILSEFTPEYTVSIILMCIVIFIFLPRLTGNLAYTIINMKDRIALQRSRKIVCIMFLFGVPLGYFISALGGASTWTYFSITLVTVYLCYRMLNDRIKLADPSLLDVSYLSCDEWRLLHVSLGSNPDPVGLEIILTQLLKHRYLLKDEILHQRETCYLARMTYMLWPSIAKAMARDALSDVILKSRRLPDDYAPSPDSIASAPPMVAAEVVPVGEAVAVRACKMSDDRDIEKNYN
jgi:hypothetical protein